jgi:hypothetical protein
MSNSIALVRLTIDPTLGDSTRACTPDILSVVAGSCADVAPVPASPPKFFRDPVGVNLSAEDVVPHDLGPRRRRMAFKLFVGGLPFSTTSEELRKHFSGSGNVLSATVVTDRFSGQSRGFGFVEMSTQVEAKAAITMFDGQLFGGRRLKVEMANPQARTDRPRKEMAGVGRWRTSRW